MVREKKTLLLEPEESKNLGATRAFKFDTQISQFIKPWLNKQSPFLM